MKNKRSNFKQKKMVLKTFENTFIIYKNNFLKKKFKKITLMHLRFAEQMLSLNSTMFEKFKFVTIFI